MAVPFLRTKLFIPPARPNMVPRPHLIERLNASLDCKLTLVSAPPGFGKTTLLSAWAYSCGLPVAWVSLDKGDNEPSRFLMYLTAALQHIRLNIGAASLSLLNTSQFSPTKIPVETFLTGLINDLAELTGSCLLILDDYHVITDLAIHQAVLFFVENRPEQLHFVISSRADPPWPLARLRAQRQVNDIRASDLRFTSMEAGIYLNGSMCLNVPDPDVEILEARTEGWIAGLQMAALSLKGRQDIHGFVSEFAGSHHFVSDFLMEEVLSQQTSETREFLLKTSVLERLTPPLCDAILGCMNSRELLTKLEQANLFLVPMDEERRWYRFHHLFRDLLLANLESIYPGEAQSLARKASSWFASAGLYEEAIEYAFTSSDQELAARMIEESIVHLHMQNKHVAITRWTEALPAEVIRERPWLCVYRAWGYYWTGEREQVGHWLNSAEAGLQPGKLAANGALLSEEDFRHIRGHIAAVRSHYCLTNEDIPGVLKYSQESLALLPAGDEMICETAVALGGAYWALGDTQQSEKAFGMSRANALQGNHPTIAVAPACYVALQQIIQGRLKDAMATCQEALAWATVPSGKELPIAGFPNIRIGDLLCEWNRLDEAAHHLELGVEQCFQLGQADVLADGYVALARLLIMNGNFERSIEYLDKADQVAKHTKVDPFVQCWLEHCRIQLYIARNDFQALEDWVNKCGLTVDGELSYHYDLNHLNLALALVTLGAKSKDMAALENASRLLGRLRTAAEKFSWVDKLIRIFILEAFVYLLNDKVCQAEEVLWQAISYAQPSGYIRVFVDGGTQVRDLLERTLLDCPPQNVVLQDYAKQILEAFPGTQAREVKKSTLSMTIPDLVEPLTERELEVLQLLATGQTSTEIADNLYVASSTVRTHIKSIYGKLDVNRRLEAIEKAKELGIIS